MSQLPPAHHEIAMCALRPAESGDGFVMDLANGANETMRLEFAAWFVPLLLRMLPRIDAALRHGAAQADGSLIAYPLESWNVENVGAGLGVALHLRDGRAVDAAFHLGPEAARALHQALGEAIDPACGAGPPLN